LDIVAAVVVLDADVVRSAGVVVEVDVELELVLPPHPTIASVATAIPTIASW
jgi:hypothetical protein